jgi:hypothetical protein
MIGRFIMSNQHDHPRMRTGRMTRRTAFEALDNVCSVPLHVFNVRSVVEGWVLVPDVVEYILLEC